MNLLYSYFQCQRRIYDHAKHLWWSFFRKYLTTKILNVLDGDQDFKDDVTIFDSLNDKNDLHKYENGDDDFDEIEENEIDPRQYKKKG